MIQNRPNVTGQRYNAIDLGIYFGYKFGTKCDILMPKRQDTKYDAINLETCFG